MRWVVAAAVVFVVSLVALYLPRVAPFEALELNWQGKVLATAVILAVVVGWPDICWREVGLAAPRSDWVRPFAIAMAGFVAAGVLLNFAWPGDDPSLEDVLFQATMPGLQEELLFRGVLLSLLDRAFLARRRLWGADVGWGVVLTSVLFGSIHGVGLLQGQVLVDPGAFAFTTVLGFFLGWARARCGSVWPCVVLHNLWNVVGVAVSAAL